MSQNYKRKLQEVITPWIFAGKVIIIYGARQVGKTTLSMELIKNVPDSLYLNCEKSRISELLESGNTERIKTYIGNSRLVVLDEAQKIRNIGLILKLLHDSFPELQIIATGSSSFDLLNKVSEPLTGRNVKFQLFPFSYAELLQVDPLPVLDERLELYLRYGMYPDIVNRPEAQKIKLLDELTSDYLFRDVLNFENLKHPDLLKKLVKALALQIGNQVSFNELSKLLRVSVETIQRYLEILERSFIIFRLGSFSRNLRKELAHSQKYYFYDLGIRNSLIQNFNPLQDRTDSGALWENFCIVERLKSNQNKQIPVNQYFWRTYEQKEIDLIEESGGNLSSFEFKYKKKKKTKIPKEFLSVYPGSDFSVINRDNYPGFIL